MASQLTKGLPLNIYASLGPCALLTAFLINMPQQCGSSDSVSEVYGACRPEKVCITEVVLVAEILMKRTDMLKKET